MKLIHVSDLHIGKRLHERLLLEDQKFVLDQVIELVIKEKADGLVIAGDVYDRNVPSESAVRLFNDFISKLAEKNIPVYCISGNHDSAERLDFLRNLLKINKVYIAGVQAEKISCHDEYGPYNIYLLPYKKMEELHEILSEMKVDTGQRNILVAHAFVVGSEMNIRCESELISIGGADEISAHSFSDFDYVALGHLHTKQEVAPGVWYAGSPLMYSFSEVGHSKCALIIEMKEKGQCNIGKHELKPLHPLRAIKGPLQELVAKENVSQGDSQDYIRATLTDEEELMEPMKALREVYPNVLRMDIENSRTAQSDQVLSADKIENRTFFQLFDEFYEKQNNQCMNEKERNLLDIMWKKIGED